MVSVLSRLGRLGSLVRRELADWSLTPAQVTGIYLVLGFAGLVFSDVLLLMVLSDPVLQRVQTLKGGVEVLLTAALVYGLTYASRRSLRDRATEVERHRKELRILHRILRHDLRNQLTVLKGQTTQLRELLTTEDREVTCEEILETVDDIIRFTEKVQEIRKLTERSTHTTVDLSALVPEFVADHEHVTDDVTVETSVPAQAAVTVSAQFENALAELVENAVVHGDDREPWVAISVDPDAGPAGMTVVEVADNGPGLPDYVEQVLSDGERNELVHLDGLGLWFVYLTVVESDGQFTIVSGEDGTTIRMILPDAGVGYTTPEAGDFPVSGRGAAD